MSGNDALDRAVRALRETGETSDADVARTRRRIMETLHRGERRGRRTLWVLLPIAAVLAGSTALAKNSDVVRRIWTGVAETVGMAEPAERSALPIRRANEHEPRASSPSMGKHENGVPSIRADDEASADKGLPAESARVAESEASVNSGSPAASGVPAHEPPAVNTPSPGASGAARKANATARRGDPARNGGDLAAAEDPTPPSGEQVEAEPPGTADRAIDTAEAASLQLYKQAYRLHFVEQRYAAALAAWDEYLRASPSGRLVVEARYNRAIALVRLGRRAEAESALAPFARGEVNRGYRAREARELLDALNGSGR